MLKKTNIYTNTKYYIFFCVILLCSNVQAQNEDDKHAEILEYKNEQDGTGQYEFSYKTSNGIEREENGHLEEAGTPNERYVVKGSYSYTLPDGTHITMYYVADENGYRVSRYPPEDYSAPEAPPEATPEAPPIAVISLSPGTLGSLLGK